MKPARWQPPHLFNVSKILHTETFKLGKGRLKNFDWKESSEIEANQKDYPLPNLNVSVCKIFVSVPSS